jgi:hypothetical protein
MMRSVNHLSRRLLLLVLQILMGMLELALNLKLVLNPELVLELLLVQLLFTHPWLLSLKHLGTLV